MAICLNSRKFWSRDLRRLQVWPFNNLPHLSAADLQSETLAEWHLQSSAIIKFLHGHRLLHGATFYLTMSLPASPGTINGIWYSGIARGGSSQSLKELPLVIQRAPPLWSHSKQVKCSLQYWLLFPSSYATHLDHSIKWVWYSWFKSASQDRLMTYKKVIWEDEHEGHNPQAALLQVHCSPNSGIARGGAPH